MSACQFGQCRHCSEYEEGRKDLAETIMKELEKQINFYNQIADTIAFNDNYYGRMAQIEIIKQYIQDLIKR